MNFADAIRMAAASAPPQEQAEATCPAATEENEIMVNEPHGTPLENAVLQNAEPIFGIGSDEQVHLPEPPSVMVTSGNVVRLELFLGAEQLNAMLRAVMQGQHSVMTIREAASYLRMNTGALERMAVDGEIPAFSIEGRWRFAKGTLDEWLAVKSYQHEGEQADVA